MNELQYLERLGAVEPVDPGLLERTAAALALAAEEETTAAARHGVHTLPSDRVMLPPPARLRRWSVRFAAVAAAIVLVGAVGLLARPGTAGGPPAAAASELQLLAQAAASQPVTAPLGAGQYIYTDSVEAYTSTTFETGGASYTVLLPETRQIWIGADGSGRLVESYGQPAFLSPQDRAAWVAAGSPNQAEPSSDESFGPGGLSDGPGDLSSLPTDPQALAAMIDSRQVEGGPPGAAEDFVQIGDLLRETNASPALRSALYQVAAGLPGIDMMGAVTDHDGRAGVGVGYVSAGVRHELIFDPTTSALMGEEDVVVTQAPSGAAPGTGSQYPVGTVVDWVVYLQSAVVDTTGAGPSSVVVPPSNDAGGDAPAPVGSGLAQ